MVELEENPMQAPVKLRRTSGFSARHKKKGKTKPKPRPKESFPGITEETAKAIEDALFQALSDDEQYPTSLLNTLKNLPWEGMLDTIPIEERHINGSC